MIADRVLAFVDTNVLVYAFEKSASTKKVVALDLLGKLMDEDRLRVSSQILQELFVTLTGKVKNRCSSAEAMAVLERLSLWPLITIDFAIIRTAVRLVEESKISFWDALIVACAARAGATVLHTEDLNHGQEILGVRINNPFAGC